MRKNVIFIFVLCLSMTLISCGPKTIYDEDIKTNTQLERHRLMDYEKIEGFRFQLPAAWKLYEPNKDRDKWIFKHGPIGGQQAMLTVEVQHDKRYFYKYPDIKQKLANELKAQMLGANEYKTNAFRFITPVNNLVKIDNLLCAWLMAFYDYSEREWHRGTGMIYARAGIWEVERQILFKLTTTQDAWNDYYAENFRTILQSCRSKKATEYEQYRLRSGKDDAISDAMKNASSSSNTNSPANSNTNTDFKEEPKTYTLFEDFKATLSNAWIVEESSKTKVLLKRTLGKDNPAYLSIELNEGEEFFYKYSDIKERLEKKLNSKMLNANEYKSSAFRFINDNCTVMKVGDYLHAWILVFVDFRDRKNKEGTNVVYASAGFSCRQSENKLPFWLNRACRF